MTTHKKADGHLLKMTHLSHGHYRISDADAGRLVRDNGQKSLPRVGWESDVKLPDGRIASLLRTPMRYGGPKRGWVWCVVPRTHWTPSDYRI